MAKTVPSPEQVLALAYKIRDAKAALLQLEEQWNELFIPKSERAQTVRSDGSTLMNRVLEFLGKDETGTFSAFDIAANIRANRNSVGPMLSRLVAEGKIEKRGHGTYGAIRKVSGTDVAGFTIRQEESPDAA
jgi:hypothetical protein